MSSHTPAADAADSSHENKHFWTLSLGAIGVVYGDIGTSPLYAFREALNQAAPTGIGAEEILGVLSLAIWSLIMVVTVKYVLFLMRADNEGEGGVIALLALAGRAVGRRTGLLLALGAAGAALFYGDAIITPALSVLSAVEGLKTLPGVGDSISQHRILEISSVILIVLFVVQSRGTDMVSKLFGPVCVVWFATLAALGLLHVSDEPGILMALLPHHAVWFLFTHGLTGLFVLGAVFLTVTGAEALTADMGHFGRKPIQAMWFALVFPALALNYLGQGAFALNALEAAQAAGKPFVNQDWFFLMAPDAFRVPLVLIATAATIIASQAVISGAYSLTQQAIRLGLLPRLHIAQTSKTHIGQIYIPTINWLLLVGVLVLSFGFKTSSAMASAYGIAVTGTMVITTLLAFVIVYRAWKWPLWGAVAFIVPFLTLDLVFFGANCLRVIEGGWVPLLVAGVIGLLIRVWVRGRALIADYEQGNALPVKVLAASLASKSRDMVEGTAIFLTSQPDIVPSALLHNLKHNRVFHERNLIVTVKTTSSPHVPPEERLELVPVDDHFACVHIRYGFMDQPDVPAALAPLKVEKQASYFIGRNTLRASGDQGLPLWQDHIMIFLQRNASDPTDYFRIPPNRVVELGTQLVI